MLQLTLSSIQEKIWDLFFNSDYRWIVSVGGKGSGKTQLAVFILYELLTNEKYRGSRILIARESLRDLRNTLVAGLERLLAENPYLKSLITTNLNLQVIRNEATDVEIYYLSLNEKNAQYKSVLSYEFNVIIIDEVDRISKEAFVEVSERYRLVHDFSKGMLILNPCSQEHWVYKEFVEKNRKDTYIVRSSTYDNYLVVRVNKKDWEAMTPYIYNGREFFVSNNIRYEKLYEIGDIVIAKRFNVSHSFITEMEMKPLGYRKIMLDGEWGAFDYGGGLFEDVFDEQNIITIDNRLIDITFDYTLYCGVDFGIRHSAYALVGVDYLGRIVILDDYISDNQPLKVFIEYMLERFRKKFNIKRPQMITYVGDVAGKNREIYDGYDLFTKLKKDYGLIFRGNRVRIVESIAIIKDLLEKKKLLISDQAHRSLEGFLGKFQADSHGNYKKDGFYEHLLDAIRYVVVDICKQNRPQKFKYLRTPTYVFPASYF